MKNKQTIQKLFLLLILSVLLIGIASATDTNNKTNTNKNTVEKSIQDTQPTIEIKEINKHTTTTNTKTSTTKTPTKLTINKIKTVEFSDKTMIIGTYKTSKGKPLKNTVITLNINGKKYKTKTYSSGKYFYKYQTNKVGTNTITATYPGNRKYKAATTKTTFKVNKKGTRVIISHVDDVRFSEYSRITGYFKDNNNKSISNMALRIKVNGENKYAKSNNFGEFTTYYKTKKMGKNNVIITSPTNKNYNTSTAKETFKVTKMDTIIELEASNSHYSDYALIHGTFYDDNFNLLKYATITLTINGVKKYAKTDKNGYFKYNYKTNKTGTNYVIASFSGNSYYLASNTKRSFIVSPKDTKIELTHLFEKIWGFQEYETIRGNYTDIDGNPIPYATLTVQNYGKFSKIKTDANGKFKYTYKILDEYENITISSPDTNKYTGTATSTNGPGYDGEVYIEPIGEHMIAEYVTIRGYFKNVLSNIYIYGLPLTITINGKSYKTSTSSDDVDIPYFEYTFKADKIGVNNVTVQYLQKRYTHSLNKTTFIVTGKPVKITVSSTLKTNNGKYIKIQGLVYDTKGNMIKNSPLTLKIDGKTYKTKTDNNGRYTYNYLNNNKKSHTLTVIYEGNSKYAYSQIQLKFTPQTKKGEIEVLTPYIYTVRNDPYFEDVNSIKKIGTDIFYGSYELYDGQGPEGPHATIGLLYDSYISSNVITGVTFYYKNDNTGKLITKKGSEFTDSMYVNGLIKGYTPYKAIIKYRPRTPEEISKIIKSIYY